MAGHTWRVAFQTTSCCLGGQLAPNFAARRLNLRPHHRFVLIFNLATVGAVRIAQAEVELRPGEGILILPYQFHAFPKTQREEILWLMVTFECERPAPLAQFRDKVFRFGPAIRRRLVSLLEQYCRWR